MTKGFSGASMPFAAPPVFGACIAPCRWNNRLFVSPNPLTRCLAMSVHPVSH